MWPFLSNYELIASAISSCSNLSNTQLVSYVYMLACFSDNPQESDALANSQNWSSHVQCITRAVLFVGQRRAQRIWAKCDKYECRSHATRNLQTNFCSSEIIFLWAHHVMTMRSYELILQNRVIVSIMECWACMHIVMSIVIWLQICS